MRILLLFLNLFIAALALTTPLREVPSGTGIDKRDIQENNGDELTSSKELDEFNEPSGEMIPGTGSGEIQPVPNTDPNTEQEPRDIQYEPPPPLPRALHSVFETQIILRAFDEIISYRTTLVGIGELFDDSLYRYPVPKKLIAILPLFVATSFTGMRQSGMTQEGVVAMQFSQLKEHELTQHLKDIINFIQENEQEVATDQIPEQLIALAEDQTVILAVKQRLDRFNPDQLATYLMEQNPFLREERATDIVSKIEGKYAPLIKGVKKSS